MRRLDHHSLTVPDEVALHLLARNRHPFVDRRCGQPRLPGEPKEPLFRRLFVRSNPSPSTCSASRSRETPGCAARRFSNSSTARISSAPSTSARLHALSSTFGGRVAARASTWTGRSSRGFRRPRLAPPAPPRRAAGADARSINRGSLRDCDVDAPAAGVEQPMERGSRLMREDGSVSTCEHCGHPLSVDGHVRPADRVDALVNPVQPACRDSGPNPCCAQSELEQLPEGNHAMLPGSQGHDEAIQFALSPTMDGFRCRGQRFPSHRRAWSDGGRGNVTRGAVSVTNLWPGGEGGDETNGWRG
jgi:hypothetical protein